MATEEAADKMPVEESVEPETNDTTADEHPIEQSETTAVPSESPVRKLPLKREIDELSESLTGISSLRRRKSVELYTPEAPREPIPFVIHKGAGEKFCNIEKAAQSIRATSRNSNTLMELHKLLYARGCSLAKLKDNILSFSGIPLNDTGKEKEKLNNRLSKLTRSGIMDFLDVLGLSKAGLKDDILSRLRDFLEKPGEGAYVQTPKKPKNTENEQEKEHDTPKGSTVSTPKKSTSTPKESTKTPDRKDSNEEPKEANKNRKLARRTPSSSILGPLTDAVAALSAEAEAAESSSPSGAETGSVQPKQDTSTEANPSVAQDQVEESANTSSPENTQGNREEETHLEATEDKKESNNAAISSEASVEPPAQKETCSSENVGSTEQQKSEEPAKAVFPSDDEIVAKIKELIPTFDVESTTPRQVKEALEKSFGVSLGSKSDFITQTIRTLLSEEPIAGESAAAQ